MLNFLYLLHEGVDFSFLTSSRSAEMGFKVGLRYLKYSSTLLHGAPSATLAEKPRR